MALVKCKECGSEVSSTAAACPRCGAPVATSSPILKAAGWIWTAAKLFVGLVVLIVVYRCTQAMDSAQERRSESAPASLAAAAPSPKCAPTAFAVSGEKFRREHGYIFVTATATNSGKVACGVQLKFTVFDKAGSPLASQDFWPASVRNIAPGAAEHFTYQLRFDAGAATYEIRPIDAKAWRAN
jgi:hypothetical protein